MTKIDPNAFVNVPCPKCGDKTPQTVATIQSSPRLRCPSCGVLFTVNATKVMAKLKEAQAKAEQSQRRSGL